MCAETLTLTQYVAPQTPETKQAHDDPRPYVQDPLFSLLLWTAAQQKPLKGLRE